MTLSDPTFSNYTKDQAKTYAEHRPSYAKPLYDVIIGHHVQTGGQLNVVADVGCGPGNATRDLALSFDYAIGVDPGVEMINTARQLGGYTAAHQKISYAVSGAETFDASIRETLPVVEENGGVDLVTAAMAVFHPCI